MADRNVANTATLDTLRTTYNSTAADVGDITSVTGASGVIASATDIVEAITLMNTEVTAIKDGTAVFETKITFEGATDDAYETILAITDPTADRTITFPDATGIVVTTAATQTLVDKTLTAPIINAGTLSGAFTGTADLTGLVLSGASPLVFEGATADAYETTLAVTDPTADRTVSLPNATDTLVGKATTDTLTNKSYDLGGTGNVLTGSLAEFNSALQSDSFVSLTGSETLTNKTLTSPTINGGTFSGSFTGTQDLTGLVMSGASPLVFEGATDDAYETTLAFTDPTADRSITIPNATDTLVGKATTDTLTNKSYDLGGSGNVMTGSLAEFNSALQSDSFVSLTGTETLENKTLTSPTINGGTFSGSFTGTQDLTGLVMSGASPLVFEGATSDAYETTLAFTDPTADRTITFFNATDTLVGKATTDTFTNKSYDLGGTGNSLTGSLAEFNTALQGDSFATLTGTNTLTNKTFTSPTINGGTFSGAFTGTLNVSGTVLSGASPLVFEGATDDAYETTFAIVDPTADRTVTMPNATDTLIGKATTDTLTNKSVDLGNNTLTGSLAEFNSALQSDSFATLTGSDTLTNKTFTSPTINGGTMSGSFTGTMDVTGTVLSGASPLVFEGASADAYETTWAFTDPTADRTITVPNATDTLIGKATTDTFTNKTFDLGSNTWTGSVAEFNSALQSDSFATLAGSNTLTNKTFTSPTINALTFASGQSTSGLNIGANGIIFEGATADAYETTLTAADPTADHTITIPNATMTAITTATHATQSNHIARCMALG